MSVGRIHSPYSSGSQAVDRTQTDPALDELKSSQEGKVLEGFMSQESELKVTRSDVSEVGISVSNSDSFENNWFEAGKMDHGMSFEIVIPKNMSAQEAVKHLKELISKDEKLRWLLATYVAGVSYFDNMKSDENGTYSNACNAEAVTLERWLSFSRWLWEDPLNKDTSWKLKETVMQDLGVAADRSIVRYDSDSTLSTGKTGTFLMDGLKAFKKGGVGKVGPLEFSRLHGKEYERVGLAQYKLHGKESGYDFPNMSSTCYQGEINDVYNTDTNNFHHAIGYVAFTWQMARFANNAAMARTLAQMQVAAYEKKGGEVVTQRRSEIDPYKTTDYLTHDAHGSANYYSGDVENSLTMIDGAFRIYTGEMGLEELVPYIASKCTCAPVTMAKVTDGRLVNDQERAWNVIPAERLVEDYDPKQRNDDTRGGKKTGFCTNYYSNTLENKRMNGERFSLTTSKRIQGAIDEWRKEKEPGKQLEIIRTALQFAPFDVHLRLIFAGTIFKMINASDVKWPLSPELGDEAVKLIEGMNVSADIDDLKKIWTQYFKEPFPQILETYQKWSKETCFYEGICQNPLEKYFGKIYAKACVDELHETAEKVDIHFPDDPKAYRNIRSTSPDSYSFDVLGMDGKWHNTIVKHNFISIDGRDHPLTPELSLTLFDTVYLPNWDGRSNSVKVMGDIASLLDSTVNSEKRILELLDIVKGTIANCGEKALSYTLETSLIRICERHLFISPEIAEKAISVMGSFISKNKSGDMSDYLRNRIINNPNLQDQLYLEEMGLRGMTQSILSNNGVL